MSMVLVSKSGVYLNLTVTPAVSGLEFDLETLGTMTPVGALQYDKELIAADTYHVLVWVTTNITFSGIFMILSDPALSIANVLASDIDGNEIVGAVVS